VAYRYAVFIRLLAVYVSLLANISVF